MSRGTLDDFSIQVQRDQGDADFLRNYRELAGNGQVLYSIDGLPGGQIVFAPETAYTAFEQAVNPLIERPIWTNLLLPLVVLGLFFFFKSNGR